MTDYNLYLDDVYSPKEGEWEVVRSFQEFKNHILINGLPKLVSFDHDLADIHYNPLTQQESFEYHKETGYDCAKWLIEHCKEKKLKFPEYKVHSKSEEGSERIKTLLYRQKSLDILNSIPKEELDAIASKVEAMNIQGPTVEEYFNNFDSAFNLKQNYFISTTLPYSNSSPHIGHTFEFVLADIIARYRRLSGDVIFNTGVDEHGIKIQQAAEKEGISPKDFVDKYAIIWKEFCSKYQISYDNFYRTSSESHIEKTKEFFEYLLVKGYSNQGVSSYTGKVLFQKKYTGKYCTGCECFITEKEIVDGNKCPIHKTELNELTEENWFFNLALFKNKIKDILVDKSLSKELENVKKDLNEISITRENVDWAVKLNNTSSLYVWFEALCNYILATDASHWENSLIVCGKDNLKFQAYILQAICLSLDIPQTKEVLVHGIILDDKGVKMSKSLGNIIDPITQLEKFGVSPVRNYLFFGLNTFNDSSYSEKELIALWNAQVVNGFGNLISRALHLIDIKKINLEEIEISKVWEEELDSHSNKLKEAFEAYNFPLFKEYLNGLVDRLNQRIATEKPYAIENPGLILKEIYEGIEVVSVYYKLILPEFAEKIEEALVSKKKAIIFKHL